MNILRSIAAAALASAALVSYANANQAMLIGYASVDGIENPQEAAAAKFFVEKNPDGVIIAPGETAKIDASKVDVIWIHIDRLGLGLGNVPAEFSDEATLAALKQFVADGGNLYLSKHATQLVHIMGRIDAAYAPGIFGDGDGDPAGTDVWAIMAQIGYANIEADPTQFYDRRNHPIYAGMETFLGMGQETFPMEGTGDGTKMHREDHNCMWDLNEYTYTAEGRNTVEQFEAQNNCVVLGTWGHVVDYAVAGIVEFKPEVSARSEKAAAGTIIANGLATCEWAPREGVNAYHSNLEKLTENTLNYLSEDTPQTGVETVEAASEAEASYYTLQGVEVPAKALSTGIYIKRTGASACKVMVR